MDILKGLYELLGTPHPMLSLVVVCLVGAMIGGMVSGGTWWFVGKQVEKSMSKGQVPKGSAASNPTATPSPPSLEARKSKSASTASSPITVQGNNAVISQGQSGGITAHVVVINQTPNPADAILQIQSSRAVRESDGKFHAEAIFTLSAPVANLTLKVHGRSIQRIDVAARRSGGQFGGHSGKREGYHFTNIPNAQGSYQLDIWSIEEERFNIEYTTQ